MTDQIASITLRADVSDLKTASNELDKLGQAAAGTLTAPEDRIQQTEAVTLGQVVAAAQATTLDMVYFMKGAAQ